MHIFVTGGAGFVGSRVVEQLLAQDHTVTVFDNLSNGHASSVPHGTTLIKADLCDANAVKSAIAGHDAVVHLAAQALVFESIENPQKSFDINLVGGFNLLEAMRSFGISRLVHSSTCAIYGSPVRVPVQEDDPKMPINPYGASKLAFESLLHSYHSAYGFDITMFRYFNPYGPEEMHDPETHAIPNFIRAALDGTPIPVYWQGQTVRDFFYVDDIARAHVMGLGKSGFNAYNLGSGEGLAVGDLVEMILRITGSKSEIKDLGERPGDPVQLFADTTKAQRELGWAPNVSLEVGLRRTIDRFANRS